MVNISKLTNVLNAAFLVVVGVLFFVLNPNKVDIPAAISACYVILFGMILLCFECHFSAIHRFMFSNFSFMFSWVGRLVFLVLAGTLAFGLTVIGIVGGSVTLANAVFNIIVLCTNPEYSREMRRKNAEWELEAIGALSRAAGIPGPSPAVSAMSTGNTGAKATAPVASAGAGYQAPRVAPAVPGAAPAAAGLPSGWEKLLDESSGSYYYYNAGTGTTSWDPPV